MAFKGTLDSLGIVDVLQVVAMARKAGALGLRHPGGEAKRLFFEDGDIVGVTSNAPKEQLAAVLAKLRLVDPARLDAASRTPTPALVAEGLVTAGQLDEALRRQVADVFNGVLAWRAGSFDFADGERLAPEVPRARESVQNLLMQGTKQLDDWARIAAAFPDFDVLVAMHAARASTGDIHLQPDEWQVIPLIDGKRTIREICRASTSTDYDVCRVLLHLHDAGLLETLGAPVAAALAPNLSAPPPALRHVPAGFLPAVQAEFTRMVGPIAPIILDEVAESFGVALERLPAARVVEFAERLCAEIDSADKRRQLKDVIARAARS